MVRRIQNIDCKVTEMDIVKDFPDGSFAIQCAFCSGKGLFPETPFDDDQIETKPCPVCRGKGLTIYHIEPAYIVECAYCDSSGKGWDENGYFVGDPCQVCQGYGYTIPSNLPQQAQNQLAPGIWSLLHPSIVKVAKARFEARQYADSVEAAFKEINNVIKSIVKSKTGSERDGAPLMQFAFSVERPVIELADTNTESGRNIQKGYLQIASGSMTGIRNPKAHQNLEISETRAIHHLFIASLIMSKVAEGKIAEQVT